MSISQGYEEQTVIIPYETVFSIAIAMEGKGIEVYRALQKRFQTDFLTSMVEDEKRHIRRFQELFDADTINHQWNRRPPPILRRQ